MRASNWVPALIVSLAAFATAHAAEGDGMTVRADDLRWSRWQGRLSLGTATPGWNMAPASGNSSALGLRGLSLMGDYNIAAWSLGSGSGSLRATSGLIVGPRTALGAGLPGHVAQRRSTFSVDRRLFGASAPPAGADADAEFATLPYVGVGYSGLSTRAGWSFSADLGLVALAPGQVVRFGRVFNGAQSLDDLLRDMRFAPVVQVGVSYSF